MIVIGAGMAGLCCAATLVTKGLRPLLIFETDEVAFTLRSKWVAGNTGDSCSTRRGRSPGAVAGGTAWTGS